MRRVDLTALERGTVEDWAMEGHRLAVEQAYRLPSGGRLDSAYIEAARRTIDRAIIAAGVRLARVLNDALADYRPTGAEPATAVPPTAPPTPGVYTDRDAAAHVGQIATVVGTVVSVFRSKGGNVYVNFGAEYPRQTFTAVVLASSGRWAEALDSLPGKRVGVRGRIVSYRGRVEIVLTGPGQIVPPALTARGERSARPTALPDR
jgi:hypothetical protein